MPVRKIAIPALVLALFAAALGGCGAQAQKNGDAGRRDRDNASGGAAKDAERPVATPAALQQCQSDLKLQFAEAYEAQRAPAATQVALVDSGGVSATDARDVVAPAGTTGKAATAAAGNGTGTVDKGGTAAAGPGKGAAAAASDGGAGKSAPATPARKKYKQSTDPFYAVKMGWPAPSPPLLPGAILPCRRIVAYYGNPFSKKMGILGEYPYEEMIRRFRQTVAMWNAADPKHPVQPALQLISVVAQGGAGADGMYRLRMPNTLVDKVYGWARQEHALFIMDVQVGKSTVQAELPRLEPYLKNPDVMLAIDPEFSMHYQAEGSKPGEKIGVMSAADINYASAFLEQIVEKYHLPPKILVVHRFTRRMVQNANQIKLRPDVQIVMNMDGWGAEWLKRDSYHDYIIREPVEYTGFKIFYHNDVRKPGWTLMTPAQVVEFRPYPLYIQYQ